MAPVRTVDLNADVGEATSVDGRRVELDLLGVVTTVHVACGGHAGDDASMRAIMGAARTAGVGVGAHPSYPDPEGFGRRAVSMAPDDLTSSLRAQIGACAAMARICGVPMISVKAHGSLYAEVGRGDPACAALLRALDGLCEPGTAVVLPAGAPALGAVRRAGYAALEEGFCDRAYGSDGGLVDRGVPGAVYDDPARAAHQALALAERVDTLCVHGDSPGALAMAVAVRAALTQAGVTVAAPSRP
ncbi:MAG: LamB/YcsF family protein [Acidimicrobiales bacterium]